MKVGELVSSLEILKVAIIKQRNLINLVHDDALLVEQDRVESLIALLVNFDKRETINKDVIDKIKLMFSLRWANMKTESDSYCSNEGSFNYAWYAFALACCNKAIFNLHAYQLLMPTVINLDEEELVLCMPMKNLALDTILPNDDYTKVFSLSTAVNNAIANVGILAVYHQPNFVNRDGLSEHTLTISEVKRFANTNNKLWIKYKEFNIQNSYNKVFRVTKSTILALIKLIEASVFASGVLGEYDQQEQLFAEKAYKVFYEYLELLNHKEKNNLMNQIIRKYGGGKKFQSLWLSATVKDSCITLIAKDLVRLVIDYVPGYTFKNKVVNDWVVTGRMQQTSAKKLYDVRDPFESSINANYYYYQRLVRIISLAMTYSFTSNSLFNVSYAGVENKVPAVVKKIILRILKGFSDAEYLETYYEIQNKIIIDELLEQVNFQSVEIDKTAKLLKKILGGLLAGNSDSGSYSDAQNWLQDIFQDNCFWFKNITKEQLWAQSLLILNSLKDLSGVNTSLLSLHIDGVLSLVSKTDEVSPHLNFIEASLKLAEIENVFQSQLKLHFNRQVDVSAKIRLAKIRLDGEFNNIDKEQAISNIKFIFVEKLVLAICKSPDKIVFFSSINNKIKKLALRCFNSLDSSEPNSYLIEAYNFLLNEHRLERGCFSEQGLLLAKSFLIDHCEEFEIKGKLPIDVARASKVFTL